MQNSQEGIMLNKQGRMTRFARALAAVAFVLQGAPAFAQRQAEPEASPDFQNSMKAKSDGGPASGGEAAGDSAAPSAAESSAGVQIAAAPSPTPPAPSSTPALDTRVTVRVKGATLAMFLDTISAQAKINFIITEG